MHLSTGKSSKMLALVVQAFMKNCDSFIILKQILIIGFEDSRPASEGLVGNLLGRVLPFIVVGEIVFILIEITKRLNLYLCFCFG